MGQNGRLKAMTLVEKPMCIYIYYWRAIMIVDKAVVDNEWLFFYLLAVFELLLRVIA